MDMGCCNSEFHALCDRQTTVINMYANVYIGVTIQKLHQLSDDRITRETLSYNNPCPSTDLVLLRLYLYIYIYIYIYI